MGKLRRGSQTWLYWLPNLIMFETNLTKAKLHYMSSQIPNGWPLYPNTYMKEKKDNSEQYLTYAPFHSFIVLIHAYCPGTHLQIIQFTSTFPCKYQLHPCLESLPINEQIHKSSERWLIVRAMTVERGFDFCCK